MRFNLHIGKYENNINLPDEFLEQCKQDNIEPEKVLRGFIADLCGIINLAANPKKDGYASNGSDERDLARSYYERVRYPHWYK